MIGLFGNQQFIFRCILFVGTDKRSVIILYQYSGGGGGLCYSNCMDEIFTGT